MEWIKNKIFSSARRNWNIYLSKFGRYQLIEITDPMSRLKDLPSIYLALIDSLFNECPAIMLSQFIDEGQGMLADRDQVLSELHNSRRLKAAITEEYSSTIQPPDKNREYILHIYGKPSSEWLKKILVYGGASLSHIIYGVENMDDDWLKATVKRNQTFLKWYRFKIGDIELLELREKVNILCWTSDSHLNVLLEENKGKDFLSYIEEVARKNFLIANIQEMQ